MKLTTSRSALSVLLWSLLTSSVACSGRILDVGTAPSSMAGPDTSDAGPQLAQDALARFEEQIGALAVDDTHVYLGGDGQVYSVPKAGGDVTTLVKDEAAVSTPKTSVAVDDTHVYFSNLEWRRVARVPKGGGSPEVIADDLGSPYHLALDETHLYITVERSFLPGAAPGAAILRVPKAGGAIETVAGGQPRISTLMLDGDTLYFATGYDDPEGSVRRVPKAGGEVKVLVSPVDTRRLERWSEIRSLVRVGDKLAFVEPVHEKLVFAPLEGGAAETTDLSVEAGGLAADGQSLLVVTLDRSSWTGSLLRVDDQGKTQATLAQWSYPKAPNNVMAAVSAAIAIRLDADHAYWVDFDNHSASTTAPIVAMLRFAEVR